MQTLYFKFTITERLRAVPSWLPRSRDLRTWLNIPCFNFSLSGKPKIQTLMDSSGDLKLLLTYSCVKMSRSTSKHSIFPSISCLMNDSVQTNAHTNFLREDIWITALFCRKVKLCELLTRCFKVQIFWEGHKIWLNFLLGFDVYYYLLSKWQIQVED